MTKNPALYAFLTLWLALLLPATAPAQVPLDGYLIARQDCPAPRGIRNPVNPGDITLTPMMAYRVTGKNRDDATHYQIIVAGANPERRWVAIDCGLLCSGDCVQDGGSGDDSDPIADDGTTGQPGDGTDYLLAVSWQPAFCQTHQGKTECRTQTDDRFDARNLALHGLWPQPRGNVYCGVDDLTRMLDRNGRWDELPPLPLPDALRRDLNRVMPGTASDLQRHEWIKHGTCYSETPEEYYRESLLLMEQINESLVQSLFASHIGQSISIEQLRDRFDQAFGPGSGAKVRMNCDGGGRITELWINLRGEVRDDSQLADLLAAAPDAGNECRAGLVDPVGF